MSDLPQLLHFSELPYYAVIFTSIRTEVTEDYTETNNVLTEAASAVPGFLGQESTRDGLGIAVSYWKDLESIDQWRKHLAHQTAKQRGIREWYKTYTLRICKVESHNHFVK
jgi:heme-degrading monooxygenase HmoA